METVAFEYNLCKQWIYTPPEEASNKNAYCHYNNVSGFIDVRYKSRPDLNMSFLTAHKSKGLQADYVFIINNKNREWAFLVRFMMRLFWSYY